MSGISKKAVKQEQPVTDPSNIDTVVVVCMAIVQKSEYDQLGVKNIIPASVVDANGKPLLSVPPVLIVGPSNAVLNKVSENFRRMWSAYNDLLSKALKKRDEE